MINFILGFILAYGFYKLKCENHLEQLKEKDLTIEKLNLQLFNNKKSYIKDVKKILKNKKAS